MLYRISTDNPVPLSVCENDEVRSILEDIALICSTKKGTVPGYREFGIPMNFIGRPMNAAETIAVQEITEAIAEFEVRAVLKSVDFEGVTEFGKYKITVEVEI